MRFTLSKVYIFTLSTCLFLPLMLTAQIVPDFYGAKAAGLGRASVTESDVWAIQNNIGALAGLEKPSMAFGYNTRFNLQELTTFGALLAYPIQSGAISASFTRFGTGAYHIQTAGMGYSHRISYVSLGVK